LFFFFASLSEKSLGKFNRGLGSDYSVQLAPYYSL